MASLNSQNVFPDKSEPARNWRRQGRRRVFHLSQICLRALGACGIGLWWYSLRASDDLSIEDAGFAKHDVQTSATFGADIQCWMDRASVMYMNDWSSCFHGLSHII
jgi:hypothetical protein